MDATTTSTQPQRASLTQRKPARTYLSMPRHTSPTPETPRRTTEFWSVIPADQNGVWIGGMKNSSGVWKYVTGYNEYRDESYWFWVADEITWTNWASGEPNNDGNEWCLEFYEDTKQWNDANYATTFPYVVQTEPWTEWNYISENLYDYTYDWTGIWHDIVDTRQLLSYQWAQPGS